jgi:hypothetical protein
MLKIDEINKRVIDETEDAITVIQSFLSKEVLVDRKNKLYAYADTANNQTEFFLKVGEAVDESIYDRYNSTGQKQNDRMVAAWEFPEGDTKVHEELKVRGNILRGYCWEPTYDKAKTREAYRIYSAEGYHNLLKDVEEITKSETINARVYRPDFHDVEKLVAELANSSSKYILADLCVRWGKTGTYSLLFKTLAEQYNCRVNIIASFVGTVKHSYSEEINTLKNNEHCLFIDLDADLDTNYKQVKQHLTDPSNYVAIYLPLTGTEDCYTRRVKLIRKLKSFTMTMVIEEADFGAKCIRQLRKIRPLVEDSAYSFKFVIATTGTKADQWIDIFKTDLSIYRRDYLMDVLARRDKATSIRWNVLNNQTMVTKFGYDIKELENFDDMLTVEADGKFRNETYIIEMLDYILCNRLPIRLISKDTRPLVKTKLINSNAATMLFTTRGNNVHKAMKELIDTHFPMYSTIILDGDNDITNAEAERKVKLFIRDHYEKYHNYNVIVIATDMGTRSFSVKQIKNILLLCNSGNPIQKIARGLTYWAEHPEIPCKVIDFRLDYKISNLNTYFGDLAEHSLEENAQHKSVTAIQQVIEILRATDKLTFNEYFALGENPIRPITNTELKAYMESNDNYRKNLADKIINNHLLEIDLPKDGTFIPNETINLDAIVNSNLKGDTDKKVTLRELNKTDIEDSSNDDQTIDPRKALLNYLINHKQEFNSLQYTENILRHEFLDNMSEARKNCLGVLLGVDMTVVCQIAKLLIKYGIDIY